jgi:hypothetical protein
MFDVCGKRRRKDMNVFGAKGNGRGQPASANLPLPRAVNLDEMENQLIPAPEPQMPQSPLLDPLHPMVGELMNQAPIRAVEKARRESLDGYEAMMAELKEHMESRKQWWDGIVEGVKRQAALSAVLHAKLRARYEADAKAQSEYESSELPPVKAEEDKTEGDAS